MNRPLPKLHFCSRLQVVKGIMVAVPILLFTLLVNDHFSFINFDNISRWNPGGITQVYAVTKKVNIRAAKTSPRRNKMVNRLASVVVKGYRPSTAPITINHTFRGSHQIYIYAALETIQFSFDKIDLNRYQGPETLTARIARVERLAAERPTWLKTVTVGDDGVTVAKGRRGKPQRVTLSLPADRPGVYLIDIVASEDVLISNVTSRQRLLAFNGRVFLAEGPAYAKTPFTPISLSTDGTRLAFSANHYPGRQNIEVNGATYALTNVRADQVADGLNGTTTVRVSKGDAIFTSDGLIAVAPAELIPPAVKQQEPKIPAPNTAPSDAALAKY